MIIGTIYKLVCDKTNIPFYVGSTTSPLNIRLQSHRSAAKNGTSNVARYIRGNKINPIIENIIDVTVKTKRELRRLEYKKICELMQLYPIVNTYTKEDLYNGDLVTLKLQSKIVEKVRENKKKTGVPITTFIEQATTEKLNNKSKKQSL